MILAVIAIVASTLRVSTSPLIFAAFGGMVSERAGVINIALEGMMLVGAFAGGAAAAGAHSPWVGALAAGGAGVALAMLYGLFVIELRSDQIVAGTAVNILAAGLTPFLTKILYGSTTSTPSLPLDLLRFHSGSGLVRIRAGGGSPGLDAISARGTLGQVRGRASSCAGIGGHPGQSGSLGRGLA